MTEYLAINGAPSGRAHTAHLDPAHVCDITGRSGPCRSICAKAHKPSGDAR